MTKTLPRNGNRVDDKVRYKGVLHRIDRVLGDETRIYSNLETGEELKLTKAQQAEARETSDYFTELEWVEVDDEDIKYRLSKDYQLQPTRNQEYAAFRTGILRLLDKGRYTPRQRRTRKVLEAVIDEYMATDKSGFRAPKYKTVRDIWDPDWLRAKTLTVMLPNWEKRGNHGPDPEFAKLDRATTEIMDARIAEQDGVLNIKDLQDYVNSTLWLRKDELGLTFRPRTAPGEAIGKNRVRTLLNDRNYLEKQYGKLERKEARRIAEGITLGPTGDYPLHQVEIDHTPMDILIQRPGNKPARPYITILIDRYTRYIIGFYISFEAPSWYSVAMALRLAVLPKKNYLATLKYDFVHPWLSYGSPDNLIMDRAPEFQSMALSWAAMDLRIFLRDMPAASGPDKGKVERFVRTLQREVCEQLPGYTGSNITKRDPERAIAKLFLPELEIATTAFIVDRYHPREHSGTGEAPQEMWLRYLQRGMNVKEAPSPEILGPLASELYPCVVTAQGVSIDGERYKSDGLVSVFNDNGGNLTTVARPDPFDANQVLVRHDKRWIVAKLVGKYAGLKYTRDQLAQRRAIDRMPDETPEQQYERHLANVRFQDKMTELRKRGGKKRMPPTTTPRKATSYINKPTFDANASHDGFEGYDPQNPAAPNLYDSNGPFAEPSLADKALADLPFGDRAESLRALEAIGDASALGHDTPGAIAPEEAAPPEKPARKLRPAPDTELPHTTAAAVARPINPAPVAPAAKRTAPRTFLL